jgi:hypothetical protein
MFYVLEITDTLGTHRIISEEPLERHRSDGTVTIRLVCTFQSVEGASDCVAEDKCDGWKSNGAEYDRDKRPLQNDFVIVFSSLMIRYTYNDVQYRLTRIVK